MKIGDIEDAINKGVLFLNSKQEDDGKWIDFELEVGRSTAWTTSYVATALRQRYESQCNVRLACAWLLENFRQGWGFNESVATDCDSTAWGLLALTGAGFELPTDAEELLSNYYDGKGLFRTFANRQPGDHWGEGHLDVSVIALRALLKTGYVDTRLIAQVVNRIIEAGEDKEWYAYWWDDRLYTVSHALEALTEYLSWLSRIGDRLKSTCGLIDLNDKVEERISAVRTTCRNDIQNQSLAKDPFLCALRLKAWTHSGGGDNLLHKFVYLLLDMQEPDGRWPGTAKLRVTNPAVSRPWEHENPGPLFVDVEDVFSTATVVEALETVRGRF